MKLEEANEALVAERDSLREVSRAESEALRKAVDWAESERQKWEAEVRKCEAALSESQRWAMKLEEANEALVAERDSLREASLAESEALRRAVSPSLSERLNNSREAPTSSIA